MDGSVLLAELPCVSSQSGGYWDSRSNARAGFYLYVYYVPSYVDASRGSPRFALALIWVLKCENLRAER